MSVATSASASSAQEIKAGSWVKVVKVINQADRQFLDTIWCVASVANKTVSNSGQEDALVCMKQYGCTRYLSELELIDPLPEANVGDVVQQSAFACSGVVIEKVVTYRVKNLDGSIATYNDSAIVLTGEKRAAHLKKHCEVLQSKATKAIEELGAGLALMSVNK